MSQPVKKKKVLGYSPYEYNGSVYPFADLFDEVRDVSQHGFEGIDAFILWGGQDIHPSYYKETAHPYSGAKMAPSTRDVFEWKSMLLCRAKGIPMIGICRGAQFLTIAAGGSLVQHVTGHGYDHMIETEKGQRMLSTSVHHQMMNPWKVPHKLLAWSDKPRTSRYENGKQADVREMKDHNEPEIVFYPHIKGLAFQGHPEYTHAGKDYQRLCVDLVKEHILK